MVNHDFNMQLSSEHVHESIITH